MENPIKDRHRRYCACIRAEKSKGKITEEFTRRAKALAEERYYSAIAIPDYAMTQYAEDLERNRLYTDVEGRYLEWKTGPPDKGYIQNRRAEMF